MKERKDAMNVSFEQKIGSCVREHAFVCHPQSTCKRDENPGRLVQRGARLSQPPGMRRAEELVNFLRVGGGRGRKSGTTASLLYSKSWLVGEREYILHGIIEFKLQACIHLGTHVCGVVRRVSLTVFTSWSE